MANHPKFLKLSLFLIFISLQSAFTQWQQTSGPEGGNLNEIVQIGQTLFVSASAGGVFKSTDNGSSWIPSNNGLLINGDTTVFDLVEDNGTLYISLDRNGIYKSDDTGLSWVAINSGIEMSSFQEFIVDGSEIYAPDQNGGIYYSSDQGQTWNFRPDNISSIPFYNLLLYDSKLYGFKNGLYVSEDKGISWMEVPVPVLGVNGVSAIFGNENVFYLQTDGRIYTSDDNLQTWTERININLSGPNSTLFYKFDNRVYATGSGGSFYYTEDNGISWTQLVNSGTFGTLIDLFADGTRIFMTADEGVWISEDDGINWVLSNNGITASVVTAVYANDQELYAGAPNQGIFRSADDGTSWDLRVNGLDELNSRVVYDIIEVGDNIVMAAGTGIYFSNDQGLSWTQKFDPPDNFHTTEIVYDKGVFVTGPTPANLNVSVDNGETWENKPIDITQEFEAVWGLAIQDSTIVAGTSRGEVYISEDLGIMWSEIFIPANVASVFDIEIVDDRIYVATAGGLYISDDWGQSWNPIMNSSFFVYDVEVEDYMIYGATLQGFYVTTLGRLEWIPMQDGLDWQEFGSVYVGESYVYTGTFGGGVWKIAKSELFLPPLDDDNDGVPNVEDQCPDTGPGITFTDNGCDFIAPDVLSVYALTPSCIGGNDGIIEISLDGNGYLMDISIEGIGFSNEFTGINSNAPFAIQNLSVGAYEIIVSIPQILVQRSYGVVINELEDVSGKRLSLNTSKNSVSYSVSGSTVYRVVLNGKESTFSFESSGEQIIELRNLENYNNLSIRGSNDCQGTIVDDFFLDGIVSIYPTVANESLYVKANEGEAEVRIYDLSGRLVLGTKRIRLNDLESSIDIASLKPGIYLVKIELIGTEAVKTMKIIKE